ncbi:hypothetical protein NLJ89_g10815 [Agrocybe chaxingu]|uniref:Uncharacterized protein n=1 Tax=Agrocybe chaxingu TaxID=84603 RepID=A0A9W8JXG1_9AGAR|nr:hypothetical protein NLJ89_g10815 [Agrocybe chaxingu]
MQATLNALNASMIALTQEVHLWHTESANSWIVVKNSCILGPEDLRPLQKIVPGPGFQLATAVAEGVGPVVKAYINAMANNPEAAIGTTPLPFSGLIEGYSHIFQNEEEISGISVLQHCSAVQLHDRPERRSCSGLAHEWRAGVDPVNTDADEAVLQETAEEVAYKLNEFGFIELFKKLRMEVFQIAEDVMRTMMLDNAEWNSGLTARFNIQHVNYATLERTFK